MSEVDIMNTKSDSEVLNQLQSWKKSEMDLMKNPTTHNVSFYHATHMIDNIKTLIDSLYIPLKDGTKWTDWGGFVGKLLGSFENSLFKLHIFTKQQAIDYCSKYITKDLADKDYSKIFYDNKELHLINQDTFKYYTFSGRPDGLPCNLGSQNVINALNSAIKLVKQNTNLAKLQLNA